jgi:hypothetical protein
MAVEIVPGTAQWMPTSQIRKGDTVYTDGIQITIDRDLDKYPCRSVHGPVYTTRGVVANIESIKAEAPWLYRLIIVNRLDSGADGEDTRWTVQGNDNAKWWVVRP